MKKSMFVRLATRFRGNPILSLLLRTTGTQLKDKKWIFILGCYNSGTTLLDQILAMHPKIAGMSDEGVMLTDQLPRPEDFGWRRMWWKCEDKLGIKNETSATTTIKRHWSNFFRDDREFLLEKSISNTPRAVFFANNFQPAYFIHIVRNGYAVAEGMRRKARIMEGNPYHQNGSYPIEVCAGQWARSIQSVKEQKARLENYIEITYEDLVAKPDEILGGICNFLGIQPYVHSLKDASFGVHEKNEKIRDMNSASLAKLTAEEVKKINDVAAAELQEYKYYFEP